MSLPSRNILQYMTYNVYCSLTSSMDFDKCWNLIRDYIGEQLFGPMYLVVPIFTAASYFNQLFIFAKQRSILDVLKISPPTYKIAGNLEYLIDSRKCIWFPEFDFSSWDVVDSLTFPHNYRFQLASYPGLLSKTIEVMIEKPRARSVELPTIETIVVNNNLVRSLRGKRHFYMITEVILASHVRFVVRVGESSKEFAYSQDVPIAIRYRKFKVRRDGFIDREIFSRMRYRVRHAHWLKPKDIPLPKSVLPNDRNKRISRKRRTPLTITENEACIQSTPSAGFSFELGPGGTRELPVANVRIRTQEEEEEELEAI